MLYWFAYCFLWLFSKLFFPITARGLENIPPGGNVILASNHISNLDPIAVGLAYRRHTSYLAKDSLFKNKIFGFILLNVSSAFPIKRNTGDVGALREAIRRLKKRGSLVIFPEGTRRAEGKNTHQGIGFLAAKSGVQVVPVFVVGSDRALPVGAKWPVRHPVEVIFGRPLNFWGQKDYEQVAADIMRAIHALNPSGKPPF